MGNLLLRRLSATFEAEPERYLDPSRNKAPAADRGAASTCPMHPEVAQIGPRSRPKCGMALESDDIGTERGLNPKLVGMKQRHGWRLASVSVIGNALRLCVVQLD